MIDDNLLMSAVQVNIKTGNMDLAKQCLAFIKNEEIRKSLSLQIHNSVSEIPTSISTFENSSIDWKNHALFFKAGKCFVCEKSFSRKESQYMGIGPMCGGWNYKWSEDKAPTQEIEDSLNSSFKYSEYLKEKGSNYLVDIMSKNNFIAFKNNLNSFQIIRETEKAIQIKGKTTTWIPKKSIIHVEGILFVASWKASELK